MNKVLSISISPRVNEGHPMEECVSKLKRFIPDIQHAERIHNYFWTLLFSMQLLAILYIFRVRFERNGLRGNLG